MGISEKERLRRQVHEKHRISHSAMWLAVIAGLYFILMAATGHPAGPMLLSGGICLTAGWQALNKRCKARGYKQKLRNIEGKEKVPAG